MTPAFPAMTDGQLAVRNFKKDNIDEIRHLQQSKLLSEGDLIWFCRERGIPVRGLHRGDPGLFLGRGWLDRDDSDDGGEPLFHKFRIYPLHCILSALPRNELKAKETSSDKLINSQSPKWNSIADMACLLEPVYWPHIIGELSYQEDESHHWADLKAYKSKALHLVGQLDVNEWSDAHESLRQAAAWLDDNPALYLLLRVSLWEIRCDLTGRVAGSLWLRHMAEVIRRAFEEAKDVQWLEEDRSFGTWHPNGRIQMFGSERPLDDEQRAKPYLAYLFGLFTGSVVRWYVEGATEFYAVSQLLPELSKSGIELVNLEGAISNERHNAAIKLGGMLAQDKALRRFSIISFDRNPRNKKERVAEKVICQLAKNDQIVGQCWRHVPDFEFANFTIGELVEIAARLDEAHSFPAEPIRNADWSNIRAGKEFEERYCRLSSRKSGKLKDEEWGAALGKYAKEQPIREDGARRPIWDQISAAIYCWNSNYDYERSHFRVDPESLTRVSR